MNGKILFLKYNPRLFDHNLHICNKIMNTVTNLFEKSGCVGIEWGRGREQLEEKGWIEG